VRRIVARFVAYAGIAALTLSAAMVAPRIAAASAGSAFRVTGPFQPYYPPPFADTCTVHRFGEGEAPPLSGIPDDPLCVEYTKRDITLADGGAIRFLLAEPARFLVAAAKCRYWQQDHWRVPIAPGQLPLIRWDGSYWFDEGTGRAGAQLHDLRVGGVPVGAAQLAALIAPLSPALAAYFRAFGAGGTGAAYVGTIPFNPLCTH
jgi:hypothetical protein